MRSRCLSVLLGFGLCAATAAIGSFEPPATAFVTYLLRENEHEKGALDNFASVRTESPWAYVILPVDSDSDEVVVLIPDLVVFRNPYNVAALRSAIQNELNTLPAPTRLVIEKVPTSAVRRRKSKDRIYNDGTEGGRSSELLPPYFPEIGYDKARMLAETNAAPTGSQPDKEDDDDDEISIDINDDDIDQEKKSIPPANTTGGGDSAPSRVRSALTAVSDWWRDPTDSITMQWNLHPKQTVTRLGWSHPPGRPSPALAAHVAIPFLFPVEASVIADPLGLLRIHDDMLAVRLAWGSHISTTPMPPSPPSVVPPTTQAPPLADPQKLDSPDLLAVADTATQERVIDDKVPPIAAAVPQHLMIYEEELGSEGVRRMLGQKSQQNEADAPSWWMPNNEEPDAFDPADVAKLAQRSNTFSEYRQEAGTEDRGSVGDRGGGGRMSRASTKQHARKNRRLNKERGQGSEVAEHDLPMGSAGSAHHNVGTAAAAASSSSSRGTFLAARHERSNSTIDKAEKRRMRDEKRNRRKDTAQKKFHRLADNLSIAQANDYDDDDF